MFRLDTREFLFLCLSFDFINTCKLTPFVRSFVSGPSRPDTRRRERIINRSTIGVAVGEDFSAGGAPFNTTLAIIFVLIFVRTGNGLGPGKLNRSGC